MADSSSDNLSNGSSSPFHHPQQPLQRSRSFDRFIPFRPELDVDGAHHRLLHRSPSPSSADNSKRFFSSLSANRQALNSGMASTRSLSLDHRDRPRPPLEYQRRLSLALDLRDLPGTGSGRILPFSSCTPPRRPSESALNSSRSSDHAVWAEGGSPRMGGTPPRTPRKIRPEPDTVLLVALRDDFYCSLMDWGRSNAIGVGVKGGAYIWNAITRACKHIQPYLPAFSRNDVSITTPTAATTTTTTVATTTTFTTTTTRGDEDGGGGAGGWGEERVGGPLPGGLGERRGIGRGRGGDREYRRPKGHVSSVRWDKAGSRLALGYNHGELLIWDAGAMDLSQKMTMPDDVQLDSLCWWNNTIFCGTSSGRVFHFDLRVKSPLPTACAPVHRRHVCNVQLAPDESTLACGGADGVISIWEPRAKSVTTKLHAHKSAARALAWCPWRRSVLASGGGSSDGFIRVWSVSAGTVKTEVNTGMQVCHVLWSEEYREVVSGHSGSGRYELLLWTVRDLNLTLFGRLQSPRGRPLSQCLSPDHTTLASASADDHLSLWKLFPKKRRSVLSTSPLNLDRFIR